MKETLSHFSDVVRQWRQMLMLTFKAGFLRRAISKTYRASQRKKERNDQQPDHLHMYDQGFSLMPLYIIQRGSIQRIKLNTASFFALMCLSKPITLDNHCCDARYKLSPLRVFCFRLCGRSHKIMWIFFHVKWYLWVPPTLHRCYQIMTIQCCLKIHQEHKTYNSKEQDRYKRKGQEITPAANLGINRTER